MSAALSRPQKYWLPLLMIVLLVVVLVGVWLVLKVRTADSLVSKGSLENQEATPAGSPAGSGEGQEAEKLPEGWEKQTGIIYALGASLDAQGTHQLVSREGDLLMLLDAGDEKLRMAEGMEAEVQGPVRRTVAGDQKLMRVEKIIFR